MGRPTEQSTLDLDEFIVFLEINRQLYANFVTRIDEIFKECFHPLSEDEMKHYIKELMPHVRFDSHQHFDLSRCHSILSRLIQDHQEDTDDSGSDFHQDNLEQQQAEGRHGQAEG